MTAVPMIQNFATELAKAELLEQNLKFRLGLKNIDVLQLYHDWLIAHDFKAEENGWPSSAAYDETNVERFIADTKD